MKLFLFVFALTVQGLVFLPFSLGMDGDDPDAKPPKLTTPPLVTRELGIGHLERDPEQSPTSHGSGAVQPDSPDSEPTTPKNANTANRELPPSPPLIHTQSTIQIGPIKRPVVGKRGKSEPLSQAPNSRKVDFKAGLTQSFIDQAMPNVEILGVDDSFVTKKQMARGFQSMGFRTADIQATENSPAKPSQYSHADDGQIAVEMVTKRLKETGKNYSLIVMDMSMPNMTGDDAIAAIRALEAEAGIGRNDPRAAVIIGNSAYDHKNAGGKEENDKADALEGKLRKEGNLPKGYDDLKLVSPIEKLFYLSGADFAKTKGSSMSEYTLFLQKSMMDRGMIPPAQERKNSENGVEEISESLKKSQLCEEASQGSGTHVAPHPHHIKNLKDAVSPYTVEKSVGSDVKKNVSNDPK